MVRVGLQVVPGSAQVRGHGWGGQGRGWGWKIPGVVQGHQDVRDDRVQIGGPRAGPVSKSQ